MRLGAGGDGHGRSPQSGGTTWRDGTARLAQATTVRSRPPTGSRSCDHTPMPDLRSRLLVEPGRKVRLEDFDTSATHGHDKADCGEDHGRAAGPPRRPAGPLLGRGEALGARRPPGHRRRRQGRHDQQGHGGVQPAGLPGHVVQGARAPEELAHDYLWRVHKAVPRKGEIGIFNRSHYEDVLVVRVHDLVPKAVWSKRYDQINAFERHLADNGTTIVKFFLSIDQDEQRERFQARYDDPTKRWKFSMGDLEERKLWDDYQAAFDDVLVEDVDRLGAVVRHPGGPQVVPRTSPCRRSSPTRSTASKPAYPPRRGRAARPRHRVAPALALAGLAATEERPEDAADDVLARAASVTTLPPVRMAVSMVSAARAPRRPPPSAWRCACRSASRLRPRLRPPPSPSAGGRSRAAAGPASSCSCPVAVVGSTPARDAACRRRRLPRRGEPGRDPLVGAVAVDRLAVLRLERARRDPALELDRRRSAP